MGKTSVIKKMTEEPRKRHQPILPIYHDLEGVRFRLEFVVLTCARKNA